MGRPLCAVAVLAAVLVAAGSAAARDPKEPTLKPVAADVRLARTFVLRGSDMPAGFADVGVDTSTGNVSVRTACQALLPDEHRLVMTADVTGHTFRHSAAGVGFSEVSSEAGLFRSATEARAGLDDWRRLGTRVDPCFEKAVAQGLAKDRPSVRVTPLSRQAAGVELYGWDVVATATVKSRAVTVEVVLVQLVHGRGAVQLTVANVGGGITAQGAAGITATLTSRLLRAPVS